MKRSAPGGSDVRKPKRPTGPEPGRKPALEFVERIKLDNGAFVERHRLPSDVLTPVWDLLHRDTTFPWTQNRFMGRLVPRQTQFCGSKGGETYTFGGRTRTALSMPAALKNLVAVLKTRLTHLPSNWGEVAVLNRYEGPGSSVSAHADNEPELGRWPTIVSVSLGATREFVVRRMTAKRREKECVKHRIPFVPDPTSYKCATKKMTIHLRHGDVLVMGGALQEYYTHEVPKSKDPVAMDVPGLGVTDVRYNVTFRPHVTSKE